MVFDGDCGFCRRWIARWQGVTGDRVEYEPFQSAAARFPGIPREEFARAVHLIELDGSHVRGAEAVVRALAHAGRRWPLALYRHVPGLAPTSEMVYRAVARRRGAAGRLTSLLWGKHVVPPGEARTVSLFLRAMGVVFAVAILSLWVQVIGLVGEGGVLPAHEHLDAIRGQVGAERYWLLPTVFWVNASDAAIHCVCVVGLSCSLLVIVGFAPGLALFGSWFAYLSLLGIGQNFLRFQWDTLLLEAGFVAMVLAPWRGWLRGAPHPSRAALWLARWLIFRLMVTSAVVKLVSGDPAWRSLTALDYHYYTQPLPPWTAWYAQHWPDGFHRFTVLFMFACEGVAPFLIFGPRRVRFAAATAIAGLQVGILVTGNYGFFNLLTLVLCIPLLDDGLWTRAPDGGGAFACGLEAGSPAPTFASSAPPRARAGRVAPRTVVAGAVFLATLVPFANAFRIGPGPLSAPYRATEPFRIANHYGLFAVMTTERPEIIIEGSRDGVQWEAYEFRYKPGDPARAPRFTTPHMPRLDWLMWFAALGRVQENRWFLALCWRLLQGSPEVRALLAHDPFGDDPPKYLRANVYEYRLTTRAERRDSGAWWMRTARGPYVRDLMLRDGVLTTAPVVPQ
jgi:predicted DCC family thiol-disulfide oxidoreductase YuxK